MNIENEKKQLLNKGKIDFIINPHPNEESSLCEDREPVDACVLTSKPSRKDTKKVFEQFHRAAQVS